MLYELLIVLSWPGRFYRFPGEDISDGIESEASEAGEVNLCIIFGEWTLKKGDMVAILSKSDPMGNASEWWRCRSRDGRMGYLPGIYLETIQRKQPAQITSGSQSGSPPGSRTQSMTSSSLASRTATLTEKKIPEMAPKIESKAGDMGVESFQKGAFYS